MSVAGIWFLFVMFFISRRASFSDAPLLCSVSFLIAFTSRFAVAETPVQTKTVVSADVKLERKLTTPSPKALLPANKAQTVLLSYLQKKAGRELKSTKYLSGTLFERISTNLSTFTAAMPISPEYTPAFYGAMGDSLLIAQNFLRSGDVQQQRRGLRIALIATRWCSSVPENTKMIGQIYDGWIMPYINAARPESWKDIGRAELLKSAARAYHVTGEKTKRAGALRLLLASDVNANTRDQTRVQLAEVLADLKRYSEAIALVQKLESPEMQGTKTWISELKQKQAAQDATTEPKQ